MPANHWQAEDRAYRIGQTRTVNVTYLVGSGTVDDFVQAVLETKGALVSAVVDGEALSGDLSGSVLDELQRALRAISPGLADTPAGIGDRELIERLLRDASNELRAAQTKSPTESGDAAACRRHRRAQARSGSARARAVGAVGHALPNQQHVAAQRPLRHHGRRHGRDVHLSRFRVSRPVPSCARREGVARDR